MPGNEGEKIVLRAGGRDWQFHRALEPAITALLEGPQPLDHLRDRVSARDKREALDALILRLAGDGLLAIQHP